MSVSETALAEELAGALERLGERLAAAQSEEDVIDAALLVRLTSASVKLFSRFCERAGYEAVPIDGSVSTTEAVRLSVALAKSQNLSPFDLSLWFGRGGGRGSNDGR